MHVFQGGDSQFQLVDNIQAVLTQALVSYMGHPY